MTDLFASIRERTVRTHDRIGVIETRLDQAVKQLSTIGPVNSKAAIKLEAVTLTLAEVNELVKDIRSEIEAGGAHLTEGVESIQDISDDIKGLREDHAQLTTLAKYIDYISQDWQQLRRLLWGVIKVRPEYRDKIREWLDGPAEQDDE